MEGGLSRLLARCGLHVYLPHISDLFIPKRGTATPHRGAAQKVTELRIDTVSHSSGALPLPTGALLLQTLDPKLRTSICIQLYILLLVYS